MSVYGDDGELLKPKRGVPRTERVRSSVLQNDRTPFIVAMVLAAAIALMLVAFENDRLQRENEWMRYFICDTKAGQSLTIDLPEWICSGKSQK